jgi:hypothetical protein
MPRGLKETSGLITIGAQTTETAAGVFTQEQVDLQLDPLNNEVFVVLAIDLNVTPPDAIAATNTQIRGSLSTTSRTALGSISDTNVLAESNDAIRAAGFVDGGVGFSRSSTETPTGNVDYIGIIATNNFFLQVKGDNNLVEKTVACKVWGYRARATDGSVYAALVQSELLTA